MKGKKRQEEPQRAAEEAESPLPGGFDLQSAMKWTAYLLIALGVAELYFGWVYLALNAVLAHLFSRKAKYAIPLAMVLLALNGALLIDLPNSAADLSGDLTLVLLAAVVLNIAAIAFALWTVSGTEFTVDALVMVGIYFYLIWIFKPELMLSQTITTGGDTASHYYPAKFLRDELIPNGHIIGWLPGWYGGMPLFQYYFPLAFVLIAVMGYVIPLQISFKLVTVLGTFLLPLAAYLCMRLMRFKSPTPALAATFTLPFLFMESHSMWGGNIPSTLAGEFTYSLSLSLTILFFGTLYRGLEDRKYPLHNAVLLAAIALTHVYTVLWVVSSSVYLLLTSNYSRIKERIIYMVKSYPLAFMLSGFWILPLLARLRYTTSYDIPWNITEDVMPPILWPFMVFALIGLVLGLHRKLGTKIGVALGACIGISILSFLSGEEWLSWTMVIAAGMIISLNSEYRLGLFTFAITVSLIFFKLASKIGVVDIRFLPFIYITLMILAAYGMSLSISRLNAKWLVPLIVLLLTVFWVNSVKAIFTTVEDKDPANMKGMGLVYYIHTTDNASQDLNLLKVGNHINLYEIPNQLMSWKYRGFTTYWIQWNYEGFEKKPLWPQFIATNDAIRGGFNDARAQFEHNDQHNSAGTVRAFESIPLFAGRSILEGLYMQSIHTSPFVFYMQSEFSDQQSCPFWAAYPCTYFNLDSGTSHLKMFNVKYIVARSDKLKEAMRENPEWNMTFQDDPYEVWELTTVPDHYVTVPKYEPVLYPTGNWKNISYQWFKNLSLNDVPIVFKANPDETDKARFKNIVQNPSIEGLTQLPRVPAAGGDCNIREKIGAEEMEFDTDCVGAPHIISISYYPSWVPEGADRVYLVSPSFMLLYPTQSHVKLTYSKLPEDWLGIALTVIAAAVIGYAIVSKDKRIKELFNLD